jgi:hypothetical protein
MLYSKQYGLGFLHYPKTAGASLIRWFSGQTGDAKFVDDSSVGVSHYGLRESRKLLLAQKLSRTPRPSLRVPNSLLGFASRHLKVRAFGVLRDPVDMLISLYEFWGQHPLTFNSPFPLMRSARQDSFRVFVEMATITHPLPRYEDFFDFRGPNWSTTELAAFDHLKPGLRELCEKWSLDWEPEKLDHLNSGPGLGIPRDSYLAELGSSIELVYKHYAWYYSHGRELALRGGAGLR